MNFINSIRRLRGGNSSDFRNYTIPDHAALRDAVRVSRITIFYENHRDTGDFGDPTRILNSDGIPKFAFGDGFPVPIVGLNTRIPTEIRRNSLPLARARVERAFGSEVEWDNSEAENRWMAETRPKF